MKKSKTILAGTMIAGAFALQGSASNAQTGSSNVVASTETIRPFQVHIPQADLDDLRRRILATKWPSSGKRSQMNRKACSSLQCRNLPAIGRKITIGAKLRRN